MLEITLNQTEQRKLNVKLSDGADYEYNEVNADLLTYDKPSKVVTADSDNATTDDNPFAKIEFTPTKNGYSGDTVVLKSKVYKLPETELSVNLNEVDEEANNTLHFTVETKAIDFEVSSGNDKVRITKISNKEFSAYLVSSGTATITVKARAYRCKEKVIQIPVNIRPQPTRLICEPDAGEWIMSVGESRVWEIIHNAENATVSASATPNGTHNYDNGARTLTINCQSASDTPSTYTLAVQRNGSVRKELNFVIRSLAQEPFVEFEKDGCFISNTGGTQEITLNTNLPQLTHQSIGNIASVSLERNSMRIQALNDGMGIIKVGYLPDKGGTEKLFKVIVNQPCVTFNGSLYPTFSVYNKGEFFFNQAQFQSGADSFVVEESEFWNYDSASNAVFFKDMTVGQKYKMKVTPVVSGQKIEANSSEITFVCIETPWTYVNVSKSSIAVDKNNEVQVVVETEATDFTFTNNNPDVIDVYRSGNVLTINSIEYGVANIEIKSRLLGKVETTKIVKVEVTTEQRTPSIEVRPPNPIILKQGERKKLGVSLIYADDYRVVNKQPNQVKFNKETEELEAGELVTSQGSFSYVEFYPISGDTEGAMHAVQVRVEQNPIPLTSMTFSNTSPTMFVDGNVGVNVTTEAPDFSVEVLDTDKVRAEMTGNSVRFVALGVPGICRVRFYAKAEGKRENYSILEINVERHSWIEVSPKEPPILYLGSSNLIYRADNNIGGLSVTMNNYNVNALRETVSEKVTLIHISPVSYGWCNVVIRGTKPGSHQASTTLVAQVLREKPYFHVNPQVLVIPNLGGSKQFTIDSNFLGNNNTRSSNRDIASARITGNNVTVIGNLKGVAYFRVWKDHQENFREKLIKVLVNQPAVVLDNNNGARLWAKRSGESWTIPQPTFVNGADDYDVVSEHPDKFTFNKDTLTLSTQGTIETDVEYRIKLIPKIQGELQDEELCSYLIVRGI